VDALGMIEVNSIVAGIQAGDAMIKAADVALVAAQCVCPGKYIVLVQGDVAAVKSATEAGIEMSKQALVNKMVIPNVHKQVFEALSCSTEIEGNNAVGVIETFSLTTCILASDTAVKAADIRLIELRLGRGLGGKSFVLMTGDVSAVKYAVEAAAKAHGDEGMIAGTVVIPSPHSDLLKAIL
jgi:microcompartment protein CcmL/EutN